MVVRSKSKPKAARAVRQKKQPSLRLRYRHAVISAELAVAARQRMEHDLEEANKQVEHYRKMWLEEIEQTKKLTENIVSLKDKIARIERQHEGYCTALRSMASAITDMHMEVGL